MAMKRLILALLWFITLSQAQDVVLPTLRLELSNFVPGCAQLCFRSFLAVNYGLNPCGRLPSLQCLCRRNGASGFTVSEGALQCIAAERNLGSCSSFEASDSVIRRALGMCDDVEDAVKPTHSVITATVVLPPSGSGPVTIPPIQTSSTLRTTSPTRTSSALPRSTFSSRSLSSTTFSTATRSSSTKSTSTLTSTLTSTSISTTTSTSTSTSTPPPPPPPLPSTGGDEADQATSKVSLSNDQIVGIAVGVAAAAALAIGAILLARYYRRRKYPGVKTGFFPTRDTWGYNVEKGPDNGSNAWLGRQGASESPDPVPQLPPLYLGGHWRPSGTPPGSASPSSQRRNVTPNATQTPPSRRMSRLLPAKPIMPLAVSKKTPSPTAQTQPKNSPVRPSPGSYSPPATIPPKKAIAPYAQPASAAAPSKPRPPAQLKLQIPGQNNPLPPLPLVQHRRESTMTEFEEDGGTSLSPNTQVWRPPSTGPLSATTYYVADKNGNWVLGGPKNAPHVAELDGSPAEPKSSVSAARPLPPPPQLSKSQTGAAPPRSKAAPQPSLDPPAEIRSASGRVAPLQSVQATDKNYPRPLFSSNQNIRRQSTRRSTRSFSRPRAASTDSGVTTICTSPEDNNMPELPTPVTMPTPPPPALFPQPMFLSPVVESPSPKGGSSPNPNPNAFDAIQPRNIPAGRNLNILPPNKRNLLYSPPGQPSPTLGMMQPGQNPKRPLNARGQRPPIHNPGLVRTGSPTMRVVRASPEVDDRTQLPSVRPSRLQPQPQQPQPQLQPRPQPGTAQRPPYHKGPHPLSNVSNPPPRRTSQQYPLPPIQTSDRPPLSVPRTEQPHPPPSSGDVHSPSSERTASTGSSLLAKRLGSDRAANMAIPTSSAAHRWRRDEFNPATPGQPGDLPATPGWMPRLTPTRRGDDLFLNVH